jgi:DNA uptake protein ComE-like DNA-binding protein
MLPQWFKDYLSFHKKERYGVLAIITILTGLIVFNMYQRLFWKGDLEEIKLKYGPRIVQFQTQTDSMATTREAHQPWLPRERKLFVFDPNTLDSTGWVALGFSPKQAASIIKYRSFGAKFRRPEDIKKLFVVDDERYEELRPFIEIKPLLETEQVKKFEDRPKWEKREYESITVELNSADSALLVQLKGIGPSYANRIIKYRELLGGYISKQQLLEVYGMDSARFVPISENIKVDTTIRVRINVNTADVKELLKHPYINLNQAKAIVNYRENHGAFKKLSDLQNIHLAKGEAYTKVSPYLRLD